MGIAGVPVQQPEDGAVGAIRPATESLAQRLADANGPDRALARPLLDRIGAVTKERGIGCCLGSDGTGRAERGQGNTNRGGHGLRESRVVCDVGTVKAVAPSCSQPVNVGDSRSAVQAVWSRGAAIWRASMGPPMYVWLARVTRQPFN